MDAMENFLLYQGGEHVSASSKDEALQLMRDKMNARPDIFSPGRIPEVLWTLAIFSKTVDELLEAFVAHAAVRSRGGAARGGGMGREIVGYDCDKAFTRLVVYAEVLSKHKGLFLLDPPLDPDAIRRAEQLQNRTFNLLEPPAICGGVVMLFCFDRFDLEVMTPTNMGCFSRYMFWMLHLFVFDADAQVHIPQ
jgi:hypothetical protein